MEEAELNSKRGLWNQGNPLWPTTSQICNSWPSALPVTAWAGNTLNTRRRLGSTQHLWGNNSSLLTPILLVRRAILIADRAILPPPPPPLLSSFHSAWKRLTGATNMPDATLQKELCDFAVKLSAVCTLELPLNGNFVPQRCSLRRPSQTLQIAGSWEGTQRGN